MGPKPNCSIKRRKFSKNEASKKITKYLKDKITKKRRVAKNPEEIIRKFMLKTGNKRRLNYLKIVCSDSGVCIAFGTNSRKIISFFDGFTNFDNVKSIRQIGVPSNNGFVKEIHYEKGGYNAYTVLKSSSRSQGDNLVYEYIVGQFINNECKFFPCFVETYGIYYYNDEASWSHCKDTNVITPNVLRNSLYIQDNPYDYAKMCQQSKYAAILIQHLKNAATLNSKRDDLFFLENDLLYILYQVYLPLSQLNKTFTHYDLHDSNVLLYEPIRGKYITYHYHLHTREVVTFKSPYIAKIIDYGRSFYKPRVSQSATLITPNKIREKLCAQPECNTVRAPCGEDFGLSWLKDRGNKEYYITSSKDNLSHDLRLITIIKGYLNMYEGVLIDMEPLIEALNKVTYGIGLKKTDKQFGTKPEGKIGLPTKINNVYDAEKALRDIILTNNIFKTNNNDRFLPEDKIGDIHVYNYISGKPMLFEPYNR